MKQSVTDKQWNAWGEKNPYLGVLGVESSRMDQKDVEAAFFKSGEAHVGSVVATIERHFPNALRSDAALDFGCGVGRLVLPLSRRFHRVTGVDISPAMIELAKARVALNPNVDFVQHVSQIESMRRYDLVHSYIVLQHIRPEQGYPIIASLVDRVAQGGFFALHLTVGDLRPARRRLNALRYRLRPLHWAYNLARKRPWDEPITEMNRYDLAQLITLLRGKHDGALVIRDFDQNDHVGVMIIGRRA
jgi:SAM-dependent methyltransferase